MKPINKPGRPFGVSLAIMASVFLFTFIPLSYVLLFFSVDSQIRLEDSGAVGIDVLGLSTSTLMIQTILGLVFLLFAIFAWRGRPASIRYIFVVAVIVLTIITIATTILPSLSGQCTAPCDSGAEVGRGLALAKLPMTILIPLYVVWYLNRGPARAFFRGYYLPDPSLSEPKEISTAQSL